MNRSIWQTTWKRFLAHPLGLGALSVILLFMLLGLFAPLLASSRPLVVQWGTTWYFPLFRYLWYSGFYTSYVDLFFNVAMLTVPVAVLGAFFTRSKWWFLSLVFSQIALFLFLVWHPIKDPAADLALAKERQRTFQEQREFIPTWGWELAHMTDYAKLNLILRRINLLDQHERLKDNGLSTPWEEEKERLSEKEGSYFQEREAWLEEEIQKIHHRVMPLLRPFHWEEDVGGSQALNPKISWWERTRPNRKDLVSALIFGVRISLVVGIASVAISLLFAIPLGSIAGYHGGSLDIALSRLMEIWEGMPTFFMLLLITAMLQSKSIFLVIAVIGIFGWTSFARFLRAESLKQRKLPYVQACKALGFSDFYTLFRHVLPNAAPPLLTLLPFAIMAAITTEAGLSFLGLGEEGSSSWGVLMDEGRRNFPGESYLLWPPAVMLTLFLVAIALAGDAFRDALDPRLRK